MFVIRSMSTTSYQAAYRSAGELIPAKLPEPYHVYLMKPEKRIRAFWSSSKFDAQLFETEIEAKEYAERHELSSWQVVPQNDADLPAYWDIH